MARSHHATLAQLRNATRQDCADPARKAAEVRALRREINQKRAIKRQRRRETALARQPGVETLKTEGAPVDPETIPIEIEREGDPRFVHHSASPEDVRALLRALPPGMADGLTRVVLGLSKRSIEARTQPGDGEPDPHTGRRGGEVFTGVYCGEILGTYYPRSRHIRLNAHVYDPAALPLPREIAALYLRLRALTTLGHEIAHHFDEVARVARGRWLANGPNRVERYAEAREYALGREVIAPLLRNRYPAESEALESWIERHGGVRIPLEKLAGDPRTTEKHGRVRLQSNAGEAFENWLSAAPETRSDPLASRLKFAQELHWADEYEPCLRILEGVLAGWPPTLRAWTFKADTLNHLERWEEAETCARTALAMDPACLDAWTELGWAAEGRRQWREALEIAARRLALVDPEKQGPELRWIMISRAVAHCGLGELALMEQCLARGVASPKALPRWRAIVRRRAHAE